MARLVIGVDVVGQRDVEALRESLHNADEALRSWFRTSNAAGSDKLVAMSTATGKAFTELGAAALSSAKAVDAFFKGPNSTFFAREYGRAEAAVKSMEAAFRSLIATQAKQTMLEMPGVQRLLAEKKAIEANIAAYQKLRDAGDITGTYNSSRNYTSLAREFASEDAMIEHHIATLKAAEIAERQYASARNAGLAASMERNLSGREALRQGAYAVSDYSQRGRDRLAAGSKAGGYDYAKQMAKEAREANSWLAKMGFSFDDASKKGKVFNAVARETANITHSLTRGVAGASGGLWLTYGSILPMITGFAATASTLKSVNLGAEFDYMARSIQKLGGLKEGADNLNLIKGALYEISKDNVFSSNEMAEGVLEFARAGKTAADAVSNLGEVSKFAYLGEMELAKAVQLVVGQTSAFKGLTEAQAVNAMAVVADKTSISLQQMGEALKNTTSLGGVMGLQFEDVAIAIGQLGQSGIRGATAGAALTTMMYKLVEPTVKAQKAMKALGVEFSAFDKTTGRIKSLREIGTELNKATEGLTKAQKSSLFENLVGLRGIKALGALVDAAKEGTKQFENMKEAIDSSNQALAGNGGASYLASMMAAVEQSGKVQKDILTASFSDLFTKSYDNSSAVNAMKELRSVVTDKDTIEALQKIVTLMLQLTEMAAKAITITVNFASDVFGGPDFSSTAAKIGASVGASLAAAVTFYFTKNLKLSLAAATAGAAIGGSAGGNAGAIEPDFYKLGEMDENADRVYAFNAAIKEQERVYASASIKVKEYAAAQKLTTEEIRKLDYNAAGGGFRVLQETADKAAGRIIELKKGLQTYEAAAAAATAGTSSFVDRLKETQKASATAFSSEDGEALTNINKQLDIVREKVHEANASKLDLLEEARSQELAEYSAKLDELMSKVVKQFGEGSDQVKDFNSFVAEGKELINTMYDGQMADALQKDLKNMEQSWESYTAFAIQANNEVVQAALQAATISVQKVVGIANGIVQTATVQAIDSATLQVYSYIANETYKDKIKGLSKPDQVRFKQLEAEFNLSRKLFDNEEYGGLLTKPKTAEEGKYLLSLGKESSDFYRNTALSATAVRELNDEEKKLLDTEIDRLKTAAQGMNINALKAAEEKLNNKTMTAGIKAENEALKQLRASITGYTNEAKDAGKVAGDWLKDNNSTLKNMDKLNKSFAEFSEFQPFTQIEYDANDMLAKYTDDLIAFKKEQEELPGLIDATGKAYDKARLARDGFAAGLAANGAGSTQEDINQLHAYDVAVDELDKDLQELTKRLFEMHNRSKSGPQDQEQLNKQMAETKAFRMQMGYYKELGKISKETYSKIAVFVKEDSDLFEKATGDKAAANELFYQRMLDYQAAVARSERDITALMAVGFKKYKIAVDREALDFYEDLLPRAIDSAADAMSDFWRNTVEGNMSAEESWRELGNTIKSVIYGIMQDLVKVELKNFIVGNASVSSVGTGAAGTGAAGTGGSGGMGLSGLGGLFTSGPSLSSGLSSMLWDYEMIHPGTILGDAAGSLAEGVDGLTNLLGDAGGSALLAGAGSLALSALTGKLDAAAATQAAGAGIGTLLAGGNPIGGVVGGMLGGLLGGMFGDDAEEFGFDPKRTYAGAWDTDSNMLKSTYVEPTTTHWSGDIFKAYGEAVVEVQKGFNTQVSALAAALPEEAADIMYNALAATNFSEILATASAGKWETADAEEAIKTATEKYSKGMLQALASAVGAGVTGYLDSYGTAGLVGDDKVWGMLTDAVQRNIETTFRTAASAISGGDYEGGLSQITQVQSAVAAIAEAVAPITEIVETAGLTDYALQIRNINKQFDEYRTQLVAAGVDMARFTDFEKARMLSLKKAADDMGGFAYVLDDLAEAAADALETAESALRDAYGAEQENLTKQHETVLEGLNNQLTIAQDAVSKLTSLTSSLRSTLERMSIESDEFARGKRQEAQATLQATLAAARRGELDPSVDLSGTLSTLSESSTGLFATFEEYQRDFWSTYLAVAELEDLSAKQLDEQETTVDALNKQIDAENKWYEKETQLLTDQLNAILGLNTSILSVAAATAKYQAAATAAAQASAQAAAAASNSGITDESYFAQKVAQLTATGVMGTVFQGVALNTVDDVKQVFANNGLTVQRHWELYGQYEGLSKPSFAVGTDYVPHDMTANIHQGERIVPAAYNRSDATNAELVDAINSLRAELRSQNGEIAKNTLKTARLLDTWDGDGMPEERVLA